MEDVYHSYFTPALHLIFFSSILHPTHGPVYIEYPLAHTFRKVVLIRHRPTTSFLCCIVFQTFFYRCTEMFPDKPNLRSRKAFSVVKKKAYMVCTSIDLFPEKKYWL